MKILSFDVSGNYSSISLLNDDEVNTFTQTHDRKDRPNWDQLFARVGFDSNEDFDALDALALAKELPLIAVSNLESLALEASQWIDEVEAEIYIAIEADLKESYFCSYQKNKDELTPTRAESVMEMNQLSSLLEKDDCYFAGTGWPVGAAKHSNFLARAEGSAESIASLAKKRLESGASFLPENANPVYLKTPDYKKI